jgi:glutamyl-Q tRNA(Asp) synthetase
VRRQSEHLGAYRDAADALRGRGLLYPCFCTRRDVARAVEAREAGGLPWPRDPDGAALYPGSCRSLDPALAAARIAGGEPHAWRLAMDRALAAAPGPHAFARFDLAACEERVAAGPERWGDAVIVRKETPTSYHLSVVHDDAVQEVTHVVRGRDLEAATDLHVLLQALLGFAAPLYHHHALLKDPEGEKLAKSAGSEPLAALRARGVTPGDVVASLGLPPIPPRAP